MSDRNDLISAAVTLRDALYNASTEYPPGEAIKVARLHAIIQFQISTLRTLPETDPSGGDYRRAADLCLIAARSANARPVSEARFRALYADTLAAIDALDGLINRHGGRSLATAALATNLSETRIADPGAAPPSPLFAPSKPIAAIPALSRRLKAENGAGALRQGRYHGATSALELEVRYDGEKDIASIDFFRLSPGGGSTWVASARTIERTTDRYHAAFEDRYGATSTGWISLLPAGDRALHGRTVIDQRLDGMPFGREIVFSVDFVSDALRLVGLETEIEAGVNPPPQLDWHGAPMSIAHALRKAGLDVEPAGSTTEIAKAPKAGWSEKDIEALMYDSAQIDMGARGFAMQLLWLSKSNRSGLLGVMFDTEDERPRQSVAVFAEEIRALYSDPFERDRKLLQTSVHEIGHALNLAHRFEREVGRADSSSFMNYDWRYGGGRKKQEFWSKFEFSFDDDELTFLRHAPFHSIVLGGAPFRSARYWSDGNGGYSPYVPEQELSDLKLEIKIPHDGRHFQFGEPVLLGITLKNETGRPLTIPSSLLDLKAGFVELLIRRIPLGRRAEGEPESFHPIVARCFDIHEDATITLQDGDVHADNMNVTFGASGFSFAEPGVYEVQALLVLYDQQNGVERIAPSKAERIYVGYPSESADMKIAEVVFSSDVGRWFALGAPARLELTGEKLFETLKSSETESAKAIEAHAVRAAMFGAARDSNRLVGGKLKATTGDVKKAADFASRLDHSAMKRFDPISARQTQSFIKTMIESAKVSAAGDSGRGKKRART